MKDNPLSLYPIFSFPSFHWVKRIRKGIENMEREKGLLLPYFLNNIIKGFRKGG